MSYSIVVPVFNSAETLNELVDRIEAVMQNYGEYELLFIDDLSTDKSWETLKAIKGNKQHVRLLRLTKNFGQSAVTICGMNEAKYDTMVFIDDDLQYQPEDIPKLIASFDPEKHYAVFGIPNKKKRGLLGRTSGVVDRLIRYILQENNSNLKFSSFRITTRKTFKETGYGEQNLRSLQVFFNMVSPTLMKSISVDYKPRLKGRSNYSFWKRLDILIEIIITLTQIPTRLFLGAAFLFLLILSFSNYLLNPASTQNTFLLISLIGFILSLGFVFLFAYVRRMYLFFQGSEVYAIWQEA